MSPFGNSGFILEIIYKNKKRQNHFIQTSNNENNNIYFRDLKLSALFCVFWFLLAERMSTICSLKSSSKDSRKCLLLNFCSVTEIITVQHMSKIRTFMFILKNYLLRYGNMAYLYKDVCESVKTGSDMKCVIWRGFKLCSNILKLYCYVCFLFIHWIKLK